MPPGHRLPASRQQGDRHLRTAVVLALSVACTFLLVSCRPAGAGLGTDSMFLLYNFSGKPVMAATVLDSEGAHGVLETPVPNESIHGLGSANPPVRGSYWITVEWIAGPGRVRWRQARLPVALDGNGRDRVEIYLRADQRVCARVLSSDVADAARAQGPLDAASCSAPVTLPDPAPGMAAHFQFDKATHSWNRHDRPGRQSLTFQKVSHPAGDVKLRFGEAFKGGPWHLTEFYSVRALGDDAALLMEAPLRPATPGLFLVIGDEKTWSSRFLGQVAGHSVAAQPQPLNEDRLLIGSGLIVDKRSGALYLLPRYSFGGGTLLELSPDGTQAAIHFSTDSYWLRQGYPMESGIDVMTLEDGTVTRIASQSLPDVASAPNSAEQIRQWFRTRCRWLPGRAACR